MSVFGKNSKSLRRALVFAWVSLLFLLIGALVWTNHSLSRQFQTSISWVTHTQQVLQQIEEAVSLVKDVETGQRGFCLTGEVSYLEPYFNAMTAVPGSVNELIELTTDNRIQHERAMEMRRRIDDRIAISQESIAAREKGPEAAIAIAKSGRGKASMAAVRSLAEEMRREERRLLIGRQTAAKESQNQHKFFGMCVLALLVVSTGAIVWMQRRLAAIQEFVRVCAWTRQVQHDGKWVPVETFLEKRFGLQTSHGMSEEAAVQFRNELKSDDLEE